MRTYLSLFRLSYKRSPVVVMMPVLIGYLLIPIMGITTYRSFGSSRCVDTISSAAHTLIPISAVLLGMAYLQMWIDNDGQEATRACRRGKQTCALAILLLSAYLSLALFPMFCVAYYAVSFPFAELIKLYAEILFSFCVLYSLSIFTRSVAVGIIAVMTYLLFCIMFCGNASFSNACLIKTTSLATTENVTGLYIPLIFAALVAVALTHIYERMFYRKY